MGADIPPPKHVQSHNHTILGVVVDPPPLDAYLALPAHVLVLKAQVRAGVAGEIASRGVRLPGDSDRGGVAARGVKLISGVGVTDIEGDGGLEELGGLTGRGLHDGDVAKIPGLIFGGGAEVEMALEVGVALAWGCGMARVTPARKAEMRVDSNIVECNVRLGLMEREVEEVVNVEGRRKKRREEEKKFI